MSASSSSDRPTSSTPIVPETGLRAWMGRYWICVQSLTVIVVLFTLLRIALVSLFVGLHAISIAGLADTLWVGLRFDVMVALIFLLPQFWHMTFTSNARAPRWFSRTLIHTGLIFNFGVILFLVCAEYLFFDEFQSRFNYIAFEYLVYPTEVVTNLWQSYPMVPILAAIGAAAIAIYLPMRKRVDLRLAVPLPFARRLAIFAAVIVVIAGLWFTTDMRTMQTTGNRVANECAGNGLYSFVYYAWTNRFDYDAFYLTQDIHEGYQRVLARVADSGDQPQAGSRAPLDRVVNSPWPRHDYNVVLVLEESLGTDFIGVLGGAEGLTPRFDALTQEGCLFDNFYSTGNRTARALEATLASLPPIPTESILKRDHSDRVFTLARLLAERDYKRIFVYGGRGLFDGMRSFMMANGFEKFVEQKDYSNPAFVTAWGVCDEDIFHKAMEEFDQLDATGRPFFSVVLTVSNHKPYTYPDGRIDLPSADQMPGNAVKYADWALGDFFEKAKNHAFYKNTIFVVMGDHGARVYGAQMFPIRTYRIPVLMIVPDNRFAGPKETGAPGTRCSTLASSLDIAPTIMSLLGGSYRSVFYGRDALHIDPASGYALMQHNHDLAMLHADGRMTVLGCPNSVNEYRLNHETFDLAPATEINGEDKKDAIAFYQTANRLYYDENYFPGDASVTPADDGAARTVHASP